MDSIRNIVKRLRESRLSEEKINYSELDHELLIQLAQQEDQRAFEELLSQYDNLIEKNVRKYVVGTGSGDRDDIKQMASLAFWDAINSYNSKIHKNGFGAFANLVIDRKLTDMLRKEDADVRKLNNLAQSTEDKIGDDGEGGEITVGDIIQGGKSAEDEYLSKEKANRILKFMEDNLSDIEMDVIRRYIEGYKVSEIAEETGMKYKRVENAIMRVKNKLAEWMRNPQNETKKVKESEDLEFTEEEKQVLRLAFSKIDEKKNMKKSSIDDEEADSEYLDLKESYQRAKSFRDTDKESGNIRDFIDILESRKNDYEIYYHKRDNGCTVFYSAKLR